MYLVFRKPVMNAAGILGFAPDPRGPVDWDEMGAFVTNPISWRPRAAAREPAVCEYHGGFLLHTGLPNPGFRAVLNKHARRWNESPLPVIVHLMADRPEESAKMIRELESMDNVIGAELGFAPLLADDVILLALDMCQGEIPLIACLPHDQVLRLGPRALAAGASAVSLAPPRGRLSRDGGTMTGRLYGRSLLPIALDLVAAATAAGIPTIGAGGVYASEHVQAMLSAGALAVQLDASLWIPGQPLQSN
jgi:dihydroorotate dehydrogenase (NAD+) catalytic subunit